MVALIDRTPRPTMRRARGMRPRARLVSRAALLVSVGSTGLLVASGRSLPNPLEVAGVALACGSYVVMLAAERHWGGLTIGFVVGAMVAPVAVALSVMPRNGDLWSYAMYGRMLGVYHLSPWTHAPAAFPHDPFRFRVGHSWSHTPSVYGPLFNVVSAAGAAVLGRAMLPTRLFYQALATSALGVGGWLVWRRTHSAAAVAFLWVHPLIVLYIVNAGRNDIIVGAFMLAAVILATREQPAAAGVAGALGALVKLTGVVGVVALVVTSAARGRRGATTRMIGAALAVFGRGFVLAGRVALVAPMQTAGGLYSRGSPWSLLATFGLTKPSPHVPLAILAVLVALVTVRHARSRPDTAVAATSGMLALGASYTLPGYATWGLPVAALDHRSRVSRIVAATGLVMVMTYEVLRHPIPGPIGSDLHPAAAVGGPLLMLVLLIALLHTHAHHTEEASPMTLVQLPLPATLPAHPLRTLVVVPTLDEAANIAVVLRRIRTAVPAADILVVDDGSTDGTPALAEAVGADLGRITTLRRIGPRGLGPAYRAGFGVGLVRDYDVLVEMDADLSHDPADLPRLLQAVGAGADLVIGSRYVPGGATPGWSAHRRALSRAGGWYARSLLGLPVRDVTSGFRAYRAGLLRDLDLDTVTTTGYGFQIDMTDRARWAGAVIREVPIVFRDRTAGSSKMSFAIVGEALLMVTRRACATRLRGRAPRPTPRPLTDGRLDSVPELTRSRPTAGVGA
jgi:dolichol-phosphate mannosyltransferase